MFGHIETNLERMQHFADIRQVQSEKPADAKQEDSGGTDLEELRSQIRSMQSQIEKLARKD